LIVARRMSKTRSPTTGRVLELIPELTTLQQLNDLRDQLTHKPLTSLETIVDDHVDEVLQLVQPTVVAQQLLEDYSDIQDTRWGRFQDTPGEINLLFKAEYGELKEMEMAADSDKMKILYNSTIQASLKVQQYRKDFLINRISKNVLRDLLEEGNMVAMRFAVSQCYPKTEDVDQVVTTVFNEKLKLKSDSLACLGYLAGFTSEKFRFDFMKNRSTVSVSHQPEMVFRIFEGFVLTAKYPIFLALICSAYFRQFEKFISDPEYKKYSEVFIAMAHTIINAIESDQLVFLVLTQQLRLREVTGKGSQKVCVISYALENEEVLFLSHPRIVSVFQSVWTDPYFLKPQSHLSETFYDVQMEFFRSYCSPSFKFGLRFACFIIFLSFFFLYLITAYTSLDASLGTFETIEYCLGLSFLIEELDQLYHLGKSYWHVSDNFFDLIIALGLTVMFILRIIAINVSVGDIYEVLFNFIAALICIASAFHILQNFRTLERFGPLGTFNYYLSNCLILTFSTNHHQNLQRYSQFCNHCFHFDFGIFLHFLLHHEGICY
jgi:hypothetical protein